MPFSSDPTIVVSASNNSMTSMLGIVNHMTDNWFGMILMIMIFVIAFMATRSNYGALRAFTFSSLISGIGAFFLSYIPIVSVYVAIAFFVSAAIGTFLLYYQSRN